MTKRLNSFALLLLTLPSAVSLKRDEGQTLAEYALILALIAVVVAAVVGLLGGKIGSIFSESRRRSRRLGDTKAEPSGRYCRPSRETAGDVLSPGRSRRA